MDNIERYQVFKDTLTEKYLFKSKVYIDNIQIYIQHNKICIDNFYTDIKNQKLNIIWSEDTVSTILENEGKRMAALNFADPYQPGGLVFQGMQSQEEDLCRCSNLYRAINQPIPKKFFYQYNLKVGKTTDRIIYSPNVMFFKNPKHYGKMFPVLCDIITCAAPKIEEELSDIEIKQRMKKIIFSALHNKVECLILGRWGCGAHGNCWGMFSELWQEVIKEIL